MPAVRNISKASLNGDGGISALSEAPRAIYVVGRAPSVCPETSSAGQRASSIQIKGFPS